MAPWKYRWFTLDGAEDCAAYNLEEARKTFEKRRMQGEADRLKKIFERRAARGSISLAEPKESGHLAFPGVRGDLSIHHEQR